MAGGVIVDTEGNVWVPFFLTAIQVRPRPMAVTKDNLTIHLVIRKIKVFLGGSPRRGGSWAAKTP